MAKTLDEQLQQQLTTFALDSFRPGQAEVIKAVLSGRDCLCIMPTGGGKSLCYQLPAVVRDGVTLVVSPLIALMKDQVDGMQALGVRATLINSTLDVGEQNHRLAQMAAGQYDLVYIAPERLRSPRFLEVAQPDFRAACWRSTKRTASASGDTIFAPTTPAWGSCAGGWAIRPRSR